MEDTAKARARGEEMRSTLFSAMRAVSSTQSLLTAVKFFPFTSTLSTPMLRLMRSVCAAPLSPYFWTISRIFDVNSAYFHNHGGYEFAKQFYADAYKAAVEIVGGEQYILSAVMHADEINRAMRLYEDWAAERITEYNFNMLSEKYQKEQGELAEKIERIQRELACEEQEETDVDRWIELIRQYAHPTELNAGMLNALIEKILVHEKTIGEDGEKEQEIEIFYRFVGKID